MPSHLVRRHFIVDVTNQQLGVSSNVQTKRWRRYNSGPFICCHFLRLLMKETALEIVGRCKRCYGESQKAYKQEKTQLMAKRKTEYQMVFKEYLWQPRTQSMKPPARRISNDKNRSQTQKKTIYGTDFVQHQLPKKITPKNYRTKRSKHLAQFEMNTDYQEYYPKKSLISSLCGEKVEFAKVTHPSDSPPFQSDTIYNNAYPSYDVATMTERKQSPIKGKDNIEISTNHKPPVEQEVEQLMPVKKSVRLYTVEEQEEFEKGFKSMYTQKLEKSPQSMTFDAVSTVMADFTKPEGFERPVSYKPPVQSRYSTEKFDDETISSMAYKPFPVKPYELPIWAKKPKYKQPEGGMCMNTLYMHEFQSPNVVRPPSPAHPRVKRKRNVVILKDIDTVKCESLSTYKQDFQKWADVIPRETYRLIEFYQPPKEKMMLETNHRADFKGEKVDKMKPCRLISQHRELDTQTDMTLITTYTETFQDPRLKRSRTRRSFSAMQKKPTLEKIPRPVTTGAIPKPNLSSYPVLSKPMSVNTTAN
ncbi:uncharacterized protein LOC132738679 isoform X3 [Ruditapes philippinarum]|uniref:uncharacterized protein LOC132738679 isoform X3 n=1 Tax=Ruditapes philippinarum TaxID=129788 RepID=UPI00295AD64D|nr:uncharacterized protein LOC132738679 isoform X3 [Ruditapes philippinarum]